MVWATSENYSVSSVSPMYTRDIHVIKLLFFSCEPFYFGVAQPRTQYSEGKIIFSPIQLSYLQRLTSNFTRFLFLVMPEYCTLKDICLYYIYVLYILVCIIHILITYMYVSHIYNCYIYCKLFFILCITIGILYRF